MKTIYEFDGSLEKNGEFISLKIIISKPVSNISKDEHYFIVQINPILRTEKRIFGYDEEQAEYLAVNFVRDLLVDRIILDEKGSGINAANLFDKNMPT